MTGLVRDRLLSAVFLPLAEAMHVSLNGADIVEKRRLAQRAEVALALLMPVFEEVGGVALIQRPVVEKVLDTGEMTDMDVEQFLREASQQIEATVLLLEHI